MNSIPTIIIAVTALVTYAGLSDFSFFEKYKFNISAVKYGQQYRMLTSGFLHADWFHFIFNMYSFWTFANFLTREFNTMNFLLIYFGSMLLGSLLTYYIHKNESYYSAVGASGAVTGIIFCAILLYPEIELLLFFAIPIPGFLFAVLYLGYSIYGMKGRFDNIGHTAHLGGAIGGLVLTLFLRPDLFESRVLFIGILLIPIAVLIYLVKMKKI
ncbi:rhomboid family intramembrane serine protease [Flavobacterium difficile]|uniref:Rhomboid family intramembrane serine protease n=1 Tax=Flavobacterium difficile TaxID=2709659 RepID=A0ABX0I9D7_9FLAO|nr:rhomboid family intramembrane serine protease [Flavobacterium difficile]NHM02459.1 rhomboid family intramembrane serine protease [Flavobacterium difficile]